MADEQFIGAPNPLTSSALAHVSGRKRLWLGAGGVALFIATIWGVHLLRPGNQQHEPMGLDFLAFYSAGDFVREGRTSQLYDLHALLAFQHRLAREGQVRITGEYAPWWNPPMYALVFAPLSRLPFPAALKIWTLINLLCFAGSCWLLARMLPAPAGVAGFGGRRGRSCGAAFPGCRGRLESLHHKGPRNLATPAGAGWKTWALVPVLLALSMPFMLAITHGQNTCTSLLLTCIVVTLWRSPPAGFASGRSLIPILAGIAAGLLFYKPQVGLALGVVLVLDLGWRAAAGIALTGAVLLLINLFALPGTLSDYLHRLPANLQFVQTHGTYVWERHVTFKAFWRLLLQGPAAGPTGRIASILAIASQTGIGCLLLWTAIRNRGAGGVRRDRLVAASIAATPLLMPFYFDYDLLLLAIPAVLLAGELAGTRTSQGKGIAAPRRGSKLSDRAIILCWAILYAWLMINPDVAIKVRVNLAVPLLTALAVMLILRANVAQPGLPSCRATAQKRSCVRGPSPQQEIQDHSDEWQHDDNDDPYYLALDRAAAGHHAHDRDDVENKNDDAENGIEHGNL